MKKITQFALFLALIFIVSSCSQKGSLIKRHYTKGYYFHRADNKPDLAVKKAAPHKELALKKEESYLKPSLKKEVPEYAKDLTAENNIAKVKQKETNKIALGKKLEKPTITILSQPRKQLDLLSKAMKTKPADQAARDALSLLWILILALLIVYIVGLLLDSFGLGWVFHILGVIILVLLILWLLRII